MKKHLKLLALGLLIFTGCGPTIDGNAEDIEALDERLTAIEASLGIGDEGIRPHLETAQIADSNMLDIVGVQARLDSLELFIEGMLQSGATDREATPCVSINDCNPVSQEDWASLLSSRSDVLRTLSPDECRETDAYDFLGFDGNEDPRFRDDGSEFHYYCDGPNQNQWGWYHGPVEDNQWGSSRTLTDGQIQQLEAGENLVLPLEAVGPPTHYQHPLNSDAVTLGDVLPGSTYCLRYTDPDYSREIELVSLETYAMSEDFVEPAFKFTEDGGSEARWYLTEMGLIPYEDGRWSTIYWLDGECKGG